MASFTSPGNWGERTLGALRNDNRDIRWRVRAFVGKAVMNGQHSHSCIWEFGKEALGGKV